jgi:hypothetical protein
MIDLIKIYNKYLLKKDAESQIKRHKDNPDMMDASSGGLCMRKHYFKVNGYEKKPTDVDSLRIMRLGTIFGNELENVMDDAFKNDLSVEYYQEILLKSDRLKVAGHLDFMIIKDKKAYIYDWKTAKAYKFRNVKKGKSDALNYEMQVATYGLMAVEQGLCESVEYLALVYYNKDTSEMFEHKIPLSALKQAEAYWLEVAERTENFKKEPIECINKVPIYRWECGKYCSWSHICEASTNIGKE